MRELWQEIYNAILPQNSREKWSHIFLQFMWKQSLQSFKSQILINKGSAQQIAAADTGRKLDIPYCSAAQVRIIIITSSPSS